MMPDRADRHKIRAGEPGGGSQLHSDLDMTFQFRSSDLGQKWVILADSFYASTTKDEFGRGRSQGTAQPAAS